MSLQLKKFLKVVLTIGLLWLILSKINLSEFIFHLSNARISILVIPIIIWPISVFISVIKWEVLLTYLKVSTNLKYLFKLYLVGSFYNNFLPTTFGGDGYKMFALSKGGRDKLSILSSLILERGFGVIGILISIVLFNPQLANNHIFFVVIVTLLVLILYNYKNIFQFLKRLTFLLKTSKSNKLEYIFIKIRKIFSNLLEIDKITYWKSIVLSMMFVLTSALSYKFIFLAFGFNVTLPSMMYSTSIIALTGLLPITINGIGIRESLAILIFSSLGVSNELALVVMFTSRVITTLLSLIGGVITIFDKDE